MPQINHGMLRLPGWRHCHAHCLMHSHRHPLEILLSPCYTENCKSSLPHQTNQRGSWVWLKPWRELRWTELQDEEANESIVLPLGTTVPKHCGRMTAQSIGKKKIFIMHFGSMSHCLNVFSLIKFWKQYKPILSSFNLHVDRYIK